MLVDSFGAFFDGAVQMGEARAELGFVRIIVYRQGGRVVVLGKLGILLFRILHGLIAVPIDVVLARYIMEDAVR